MVLSSPTDPQQASDLSRSLGADVIVTDVPAVLSDSDPAAPILALTDSPVEPDGRLRGVLPAEPTSDELAVALDAIRAGLIVLHPDTLRILHAAEVPAAQTLLTPREVQVLRMMAEGRANKEIAFDLGITEHTVKFHVSSILEKLDADSRTEAVARGIRQGLVFL
ncbi:MAG: response regulator transcription factor [Bryobacteraceae bacterium]